MEQRVETLDIYPISKGRRILLWFCDFFITFFLTFFIFNVAAYPLSKLISSFDNKMAERYDYECLKDDILYENGLLYYENESSQYQFNKNLEYTFDRFLSYWVFEDANYAKYDVIYNYFVIIKNDVNKYSQCYHANEKENEFFFLYDEYNYPIALKSEFKDLFKPYFDELDEMSKAGEETLLTFKNRFFTKTYAEVFYDIEQNDLIFNGHSFNSLSQKINYITTLQNTVYVVSALSAFAFSWIVLFIVFPLCNKHCKTLSQVILKIERIGFNNIYLIKKGEVIINAIYQLPLNISLVFFIPMLVVSFNYIFSLTTLLVLTLISLAYVIISAIFMLFNQFNRSLEDFLTQTILISTESLDEIYRKKGYKI